MEVERSKPGVDGGDRGVQMEGWRLEEERCCLELSTASEQKAVGG